MLKVGLPTRQNGPFLAATDILAPHTAADRGTAAPGKPVAGARWKSTEIYRFTSELRTAFTAGPRPHLVHLPNALMHTSLESLLEDGEVHPSRFRSIPSAVTNPRTPRNQSSDFAWTLPLLHYKNRIVHDFEKVRSNLPRRRD
jgi:hypothetical protein